MNDRADLSRWALAATIAGVLAGAIAAGRGEWFGLVAGVCAAAAAAALVMAGVAKPTPPSDALSSAPRTETRSAMTTLPVAGSFSSSSASSPSDLPDGLGGAAGGVGDDATGLFNEHYFTVAVDSRVAAARRHLRPVAIILVAVGLPGAPGALADPVAVSAAIRTTLRDSDTACHLDDGRFGVILEDTPEDGAILTAERLRRALMTAAPDFVQRAGVACYPAHAFNTTELMSKAEAALAAACDWPQHRIEVAAAD